MYSTAADRQSKRARTSSHSTKESARGLIRAIPASAHAAFQQEIDDYQKRINRRNPNVYDLLRIKAEINAKQANVRRRLRTMAPPTDIHTDPRLCHMARLSRQKAQIDRIIRLIGEKTL